MQDAASAAADFPAPPAGPSICGFAIPGIPPFPKFSLPIPSFAFPPAFLLPGLALKCDLSDPIDGDFPAGGGRVGATDLEDDPEG